MCTSPGDTRTLIATLLLNNFTSNLRNFDQHFSFNGGDAGLSLDSFQQKTLQPRLHAGSFYHLPSLSYSWDAPRVPLSAWSVCIPVELYLKASSLHRLEECTSVVGPLPTVSVCLSLSLCTCVQYLFLIWYLVHKPLLQLPRNYGCACKYTKRKRRMKMNVVYQTKKCFRMTHDLKVPFILCQMFFCACVWEIEAKEE